MSESLARSLKQHPLAAAMSLEVVEFLATCTRNERFANGQLLFTQGQANDSLYLIRKGTVELEYRVSESETVSVGGLEAGATLGASVIGEPRPWHVDVRAVGPVLAFAIPGPCLRAKLTQDHALAAQLLESLLLEVHTRLCQVRLQRCDPATLCK